MQAVQRAELGRLSHAGEPVPKGTYTTEGTSMSGNTFKVPEGCDMMFTYASIECSLEPILGTPFCKLIHVETAPDAASQHEQDGK